MSDGLSDIEAVPWSHPSPPRRVLAIRFQAFGDIIGTLPYLQSLRKRLPDGRLDLLTRRDFLDVPAQLDLFDRIHTIRGTRNYYLQRLSASLLLPRLKRQRYDVVVDLQHNRISELMRRALASPAWSAFDRFSPAPHGERVRRTIAAAWPQQITLDTPLVLRNPALGWNLIPDGDRSGELVVLNPAGFFATRNWPLASYVEFARLWLERRNAGARFLILGLPRIADKADALAGALPGRVVNLVGRTTPAEAFSIVQRVALVLSEDSGLLHMAWTSGRPTVALFGSTRSVWSKPLGARSAYLDSSDLPCGECMAETCRYDDVHCLTRFSAQQVFDLAMSVVARA
jgi:heptosyltransferase-2